MADAASFFLCERCCKTCSAQMTTIRNRIEQWFEILGHRIYENKYKTLIVMVFLIAGILSQLPKLIFDMSNEGFLHEDDQSLAALLWHS